MDKFKVGIIQMMVTDDKDKNILKAKSMIEKAVSKGVHIVVLPEMFNCPYDNIYFPKYAEIYPEGKTYKFLSDISKKENIILIGGSIPEKENENIYNSSFVFDNEGSLIGRHRKIHLFDIDVKDKIKFKESDILNSGKDITIIDTIYGKIGIVICYDIRFPEITRIMALKGVKIVFVPAAFNTVTGPSHWDILFKSRALDNQIYMVGAAPARNNKSTYISYGNSLVANPWGQIIDKLDEKENILISEIDLNYLDKIRMELPLLLHRREELYKI